MNLSILKKTLLPVSLILSVVLIILFSTPKNAAAGVSCAATPNSISTTQQTTISLSWNDTSFANRAYTLVVKRPSFVVLNEDISTDSNGNLSKPVGPFDVPERYTFDFYPKSSPDSIDCSSSFRIIDTTGAGACPPFKNYTPENIFENSSIAAHFESTDNAPPPRNAPSNFIVSIDDGKTGNFRLTSNNNEWQTSIGILKKGWHTAKLYFDIPNTIPPVISLCYVLTPINVQEGKDPGAPGENPCLGGVCKTALGDIPTNPKKFVEKVLQIAIGLGGGIAFILMVIGSIRVLTSSGDQQKLSAGRDMIVAAISGLLFIIFSVLILRFIGIEILQI